jgi:CRP-like cAMP-binding protein
MNAPFHSDVHPVIRKLGSIIKLSDSEEDALRSLPVQIAELRADQDIVREGDQPSRSCFLLEGVTCSWSNTLEGGRQILAFYVPGDAPDIQSLHLKVMDNSHGTLTPCKVAFVQHEHLRDLCFRHPRISSAFWRETLVEAAIFRKWMVGIGRKSAYGRIAHLFCEMLVRMRVVGLADGHGCPFPITQTEIGDALGLSLVHVNRTVQELRGKHLISLSGEKLKALDWEGLKEAAEFDPTYLHLENQKAAA